VPDKDDFNAPADLRKWPSLKNERVPKASVYPTSYLEEHWTIGEFMSKDHQHLYEIHTKPQPPLVTEVPEREHIVELARLREFLLR
jgi:hypothetical protein